MKLECAENLPVMRLSDEELAARDFAVDLLFEREISQYFCTVGDSLSYDEARNNRYHCTVVHRRETWTMEGQLALAGKFSK